MNLNHSFEMNAFSSRVLVADYINYRLTQHGYTWENCPPLEITVNSVQTTMRRLGNEIEERFRQEFTDMVNQLHLTPDTAYPTFHELVQELFADGVTNWGRILALFGFGGVIAVSCVDNNMPQFVDSIVDWVSTYLDSHLSHWINSSGGWEGFVEFYENGHNTDADAPWDIKKVMRYGVIGAVGAMALGAIFTQRT